MPYLPGAQFSKQKKTTLKALSKPKNYKSHFQIRGIVLQCH